MARSAIEDLLQTNAFWLFDVAPIDPLGLPIFTPLIGFSAITAPEMNIEMQEIQEGNWFFTRKVAKRASVSGITLTRGSRWVDSDFYRWTVATLTGDTGGRSTGENSPALSTALRLGGATPRRDLLLVHFLTRSPLPPEATAVAVGAGLLAAGGGAQSVAGVAAAVLGAIGQGVAASGGSVGPFEFATRLPAKAWMLYGCLPTRYKGGSDFDAMSADISMMELELALEAFDEISLAST